MADVNNSSVTLIYGHTMTRCHVEILLLYVIRDVDFF